MRSWEQNTCTSIYSLVIFWYYYVLNCILYNSEQVLYAFDTKYMSYDTHTFAEDRHSALLQAPDKTHRTPIYHVTMATKPMPFCAGFIPYGLDLSTNLEGA